MLLRIMCLISVAFFLGACQEGSKKLIQSVEGPKNPASFKIESYVRAIDLGQPFSIRPKKLPTGGDVGSHACLKGRYDHQYVAGNEVWLCCIPIDELKSESFQCAQPIPALNYDSLYTKLRFCHVQNPTSAEPIFHPVCIPAPLKAPGTGN